MAKRKTATQVIEEAQLREDKALLRRKQRLAVALKRYGPLLLDFEVRQIEAALAPAVGRITMEA